MFITFFNALKTAFKNEAFKKLFIFAVIFVFIGTFFYAELEKWTLLDSLYFCVITLATIGYGDIHPVTAGGKIFTIFFVLIGIGLLSGVIGGLYAGLRQDLQQKMQQIECSAETRPRLFRHRRRIKITK